MTGLASRDATVRAATEGGAKVLRPAAFQRSDALLVSAVLAGEEAAKRQLYKRYVGHVRRILVRVLGTDRDLADGLQDVFVEVFRHLHKLRDPSALKSWVTRLAVFVARARIRSASRRRWLRFIAPVDLPEREAPVADPEVAEALRDCYAILKAMPADERIAFALRFIDGMALQEVADACDCSLATIKRRLRRAHDKFAAEANKLDTVQPWLKGGARWR